MSNSLDVFAGENKQTTKGNASSITYGLLQALEYINKSTRYGGRTRPINEALTALKQWNQKGNKRVVIYVKSGVYREYLEIGSNMKKLFFIGDGIDRTVVTGNRNVPDSYTTLGSATFGKIT